MSRPNDAHDAERRRLLTGALLTANLKYPGDVVGWVDRENAKMEKEGTPKSELLPVLQRDAVKKFANGSRAASSRVAAVVDAFIQEFNSREQRAAARAHSTCDNDGDDGDDDDDDDGGNGGGGGGGAAAGEQPQKKRRAELDCTVAVRMTTTGVEYSIGGSSSSSIDISRAKELILLDLVKEMCIGKVAKLQSWRGGGATKVVAVHGSTGKNESKSVRHESRAHMLQHMQLLSELHSNHTQGTLEGMLHFLAGAQKVASLGFKHVPAPVQMTLKDLVLVSAGSARHALRIKRELKKYGFTIHGNEKELRAQLSSRKVAVHSSTATAGGSELQILRRVDVCAVVRDHVSHHLDHGAFIPTSIDGEDAVQVTVAFDAGANIEKVGLLLSNTTKPMSEYNLAPLAIMQNSKKTKCDHREECCKLWEDQEESDQFKRSLKSGVEEVHGASYITMSGTGTGTGTGAGAGAGAGRRISPK